MCQSCAFLQFIFTARNLQPDTEEAVWSGMIRAFVVSSDYWFAIVCSGFLQHIDIIRSSDLAKFPLNIICSTVRRRRPKDLPFLIFTSSPCGWNECMHERMRKGRNVIIYFSKDDPQLHKESRCQSLQCSSCHVHVRTFSLPLNEWWLNETLNEWTRERMQRK